ncbi:hypothetical protein HAX54_042681, partial [Datura stramonium]|nr:hypothetical protein [Datura stramonium]
VEKLDGSFYHTKEIMCATRAERVELPHVLMMVAWEIKPIPSLDQSFAKSITAQLLDEVAEDNPVEGLKNLFIAEE